MRYSILVDNQKKLYLSAESDVLVGTDGPVFLCWGEYITDPQLEKKKQSGAKLWVWAMDSSDYKACFFTDAQWTPSFPPGESLASLHSFLQYMEEHNVVQPEIACHELSITDGKYEVKSIKDCSFEIKRLPTNQQATGLNLGSILDFDKYNFETGEYGSLLKMAMRIKYIKNDRQDGLYPQKPGLFLKQPVQLTQGKLYCLD